MLNFRLVTKTCKNAMKFILIVGLLLSSVFCANGQIIGDCNAPYNTPESLVEILVGEGVEFFNVTYSGFDCSAGYFDGPSNIGFESGLVMATDGVESITPGGFGNFGGAGSDPDLELQLELVDALNNSLNNLIVLEFDFIPTSDTVTFEYVFASNEYPSYTCSQYNDIFGFFVSGPGIDGPFSDQAENIALVPDPNNPGQFTNTPVIINTVNSGTPSGAYPATNCSDIDPNWQDYSVFYTDNSTSETVSYPGFTTPLVAQAVLTACDTFHIKLAIADVADGGVNSAVFLNENSFNSTPPIEYSVSSNTINIFNDDSEYIENLYEGCGSAVITFERPEAIVGPIEFEFLLDGTATENIDYTLLNAIDNQIVMNANESSTSLQVFTGVDNFNEIMETIELTILPVDYGCYATNPDTVIFQIFDQPELELTVSNDVLLDCPGDQANLQATAIGGVGGLMQPPFLVPQYSYDWVMLGDGPTHTVNPEQPSQYCVTVTDVCGQQLVDCINVDVEVYEPIEAASDVIYICENTLTELCANAQGGNDPLTFTWSNNQTGPCITDFAGEYTVTITDQCGLQSNTSGEIYLDEAPEPLFEQYQMADDNFGVVINNYTPYMNGLTYAWDFGDGQNSTSIDPSSHSYAEWGEYIVTLGVTTNINNCYKEISNLVQVAPLYYFYAPNSFTPNGDNVNDDFSVSLVGVEAVELFIYDRWGRQLFYTNSMDEAWDGTFENTESMIGTYSYKAVVKKYFDETPYVETGYVNLIR